jgi:hypothetical protein
LSISKNYLRDSPSLKGGNSVFVSSPREEILPAILSASSLPISLHMCIDLLKEKGFAGAPAWLIEELTNENS